MFNKLILTTASIVVIFIFINIGSNKQWLERIVIPNWEILQEAIHENEEQQKTRRWGTAYVASQQIAKYVEKKGIKDPLLLFEPNQYYDSNKIPYHAPEPITFYYFTGLKSIWMDSDKIKEATHLITITPQDISVIPIKNDSLLNKIIAFYKPYKVIL